MKKCPYCKYENESDNEFCIECGSRMKNEKHITAKEETAGNKEKYDTEYSNIVSSNKVDLKAANSKGEPANEEKKSKMYYKLEEVSRNFYIAGGFSIMGYFGALYSGIIKGNKLFLAGGIVCCSIGFIISIIQGSIEGSKDKKK